MHNNTNYHGWNKALTFGVGSIQLSFRTIVFTQYMQRCFQSKCYCISVKLCRGFALKCFSFCLCVCLCVCFPYSGTSRNQEYKQQYQRLQRDTGMKYKRDFSLKRFVPKLWRRLLTSSSSGVVSGILVPFFRRN